MRRRKCYDCLSHSFQGVKKIVIVLVIRKPQKKTVSFFVASLRWNSEIGAHVRGIICYLICLSLLLMGSFVPLSLIVGVEYARHIYIFVKIIRESI